MKSLGTLGRNLAGLLLILLLIWIGLKLAKIPMPDLQPNKARILDVP